MGSSAQSQEHEESKTSPDGRRTRKAGGNGQWCIEASGQGLDRIRGPGTDAKARCGLYPKAAGTIEWC